MRTHFVNTLRRRSNQFVSSLRREPLIGNVISGSATPEQYDLFLEQTYHYVDHSGLLLAETAEGLRQTGAYPSLVDVLSAKTQEESPHYRLALNDARARGRNPELVKGSTRSRAIDAYVAWNRTMARAGSPAFLGAAYMLERASECLATEAAHNLCARAMVPNIEKSVSFLTSHGKADHGHIEALEHVLGGVDNPEGQAAIKRSAEVLCELYSHFFRP